MSNVCVAHIYMYILESLRRYIYIYIYFVHIFLRWDCCGRSFFVVVRPGTLFRVLCDWFAILRDACAAVGFVLSKLCLRLVMMVSFVYQPI